MFDLHQSRQENGNLPARQNDLQSLDIVVRELTLDQQKKVEELREAQAMTEGLARELVLRGVESKEEYHSFIRPDLTDLPEWSTLQGAREAVALILTAVSKGEKIGIYSDYDVDGTTSGALLSFALAQLNSSPLLLAPDRFTDGYGLNNKLIQKAHDDGVSLLITLDSGTHSKNEVSFLHSLGMKVIVVDHHHVPDGVDPGADVFINPKRPECGFADGALCTAGLTWMLTKGLSESSPLFDPDKLLPLVALATVCDVVPLIGANRVLTHAGLIHWREDELTDLPALRLLRERGSKELDAHALGFKIGPLINAGGRSDTGEAGALRVLQFLTTRDLDEASRLLNELSVLNEARRVACSEGFERACEQVHLLEELPPVLFVVDEDMSEGIIGIIAARLAERFHRPTYVFTKNKEGFLKGSGRNIPQSRPITTDRELSLIEIQEEAIGIFEKGGGHAGAVGVTLSPDKLETFQAMVTEAFERRASHYELRPFVTVSHEMSLAEIKRDFSRFLAESRLLEPCDPRSNPPLSAVLRGVQVVSATVLKRGHLKVLLRQSGEEGDTYCPALLWNVSTGDMEKLSVGKRVDIACKPHIDSRMKGSPTSRDMSLSILSVREV